LVRAAARRSHRIDLPFGWVSGDVPGDDVPGDDVKAGDPMGLRNRTKAPKQPKVACPSCGKPNPAPEPGAAVRCILCQSVLPVVAEMGGNEIVVPWNNHTPVREAGEASYDAPEPEDDGYDHRELDDDVSPLTNVVVEDYVPFDMDALDIGMPGLPKPSSNDS
jgi:hypothetical protein